MRIANIDQCIHVWAAQSRQEGRCGNVYFDGPTLYSYGRHFPVAQFVRNAKGEMGLLHNSGSYSVSTSRHQHLARYSTHHFPAAQTWHVPGRVFPGTGDVPVNADRMVAHYATERDAALARSVKRRKAELAQSDVSEAERCVERANAWAAFCGSRKRIRMPADMTAHLATLKRKAAAEARRDAKQVAEQAKAIAAIKAERDAKAQEARVAFIRGDRSIPDTYLLRAAPVALRLRCGGEVIETSHGAQVPASVAPELWQCATLCRRDRSALDSGPRIGSDVGDFRLSAITAEGAIIIGCHRIEYAELERFAAVLGLPAA